MFPPYDQDKGRLEVSDDAAAVQMMKEIVIDMRLFVFMAFQWFQYSC